MLCDRKHILVLFFFMSLFLVLSIDANAASLTWTGAGTDNYASTSANWSGNMSPQNGDKVVFDDTSVKNANWNLSVTLSSLRKTAGYTGSITKIAGASLTIGKFVTWTGNGADELASTSANWAGNTAPVDGDRVIFDGSVPAKNCTWNINVSPSIFVLSSDYLGAVSLNADLALSGSLTVSGGTLALNNKILNVDGYVLINPGGTIDATSSTITVKGNWSNWGNFNYGTSTVIFAGTNQTIYGDTTFYNLIKIVTTADTLYFQAGRTQTVINSLILSGTQDNLLSLYSTEPGAYWFINPQGAVIVSFARIRDMNNNNPVNIVPLNSIDEGNNDGVSFGGSECVCIGNSIILSQIVCNDRGGAC